MASVFYAVFYLEEDMKQLEEFHEKNLERIIERKKFSFTGVPVDPFKRFRVFCPWPHYYDVKSLFEVLEKVKHPIFVTYDAQVSVLRNDRPAFAGIEAYRELATVDQSAVCGQIVSIVVDEYGFSADCVALGQKAEVLLALRDRSDIAVPRIRLMGFLPKRKVEKFIGIDLTCRVDDNPSKLEFYDESLKAEFLFKPAAGWEDPRIFRTVVRYPWPTGLDPKQAMEVAREQFGGSGARKFPHLVRRADPTKEPYEPIHHEEIVGHCTLTNFSEVGLEFLFTLVGPHAVSLKSILEDSQETLVAVPFIVVEEGTGIVLRFGDVFIVENVGDLHGAPKAVFGSM